MPNEKSELTPHDINHILTDWQDEDYHRQLASREAAHDSDETTRKLLELIHERQPGQGAEERQSTDFRAIFEKNVSPSKQIPVRLYEESLAEKEQAAQREAEQGHTTLTGARKKQFGDRLPVVEAGRIIGLESPHEQNESVAEVRKGTPSRRVHRSRTSVSSRTSPTGPRGKKYYFDNDNARADSDRD